MKITWRTWARLAAAAAVYAGFGYWLSGNGNVEMWTYRIGLASASVAPLLFTGIYTVFGLTGRAKWWRNSIGTALVQAALSLVPITAPLAIALWFYNGRLAPGWLAWIEVSGPVVSALAWVRLCVLWLRLHRARLPVNGNGGQETASGTS